MTLRLNGSTSGYTEIDAPAVAGSNTLVLPTGNGSSQQVLATNGSGALSWSNRPILQIVQTVFNSEFSWTTKGSWVDMTGISATITPASTTNKILIQVMLCTGDGGNNYERAYRVVRNGSVFVEGPATASIMAQAQAGTGMGAFSSNAVVCTIPITVIDSPNTTSAVTYKLQGYASSSSVTTSYINRPYAPATNASATGISTITLTEVAA